MNIQSIKRRINLERANGKRYISVSPEELFEIIPNLSKKALKINITMDVDELLYYVEEYEKNHFKQSLKIESFEINSEGIQKINKKIIDLDKER